MQKNLLQIGNYINFVEQQILFKFISPATNRLVRPKISSYFYGQ